VVLTTNWREEGCDVRCTDSSKSTNLDSSQHNPVTETVSMSVSVVNGYIKCLKVDNIAQLKLELKVMCIINLLKHSGFFTYHQVKHYMVLALRRVLCTDLRTFSNFCFICH
jgi:hypothetical protein